MNDRPIDVSETAETLFTELQRTGGPLQAPTPDLSRIATLNTMATLLQAVALDRINDTLMGIEASLDNIHNTMAGPRNHRD